MKELLDLLFQKHINFDMTFEIKKSVLIEECSWEFDENDPHNLIIDFEVRDGEVVRDVVYDKDYNIVMEETTTDLDLKRESLEHCFEYNENMEYDILEPFKRTDSLIYNLNATVLEFLNNNEEIDINKMFSLEEVSILGSDVYIKLKIMDEKTDKPVAKMFHFVAEKY